LLQWVLEDLVDQWHLYFLLYQQALVVLEVLVVRLLLWFLVDLTVLEALVVQLIQ
jgi:hypothetical protein